MRRRQVVALCIVLALVFAAVYLVSGGTKRPALPAPGIGLAVPDFTLNNLAGEPVTLSQYRGKVVFLNFWASWCPPCRAEMPSMDRLHEVFYGQEFVILAVNTENDERVVRSFLDRNPHKFPVLLDLDGKVQNLYDVHRFPETFLIDQEGKLVERFIGARDWSATDFLKRVASMIGD
jgi:peroxiredoxin